MANIQFLYLYLLFVTVSGALSGDDDQCGASDYRTGERIRNGTVVPQGKYPWLAYLSNGCTATIVSRKYILTAGHCVCQRRPNGSPPLPCDLKNHHEIQVVVGSVNHLEGQEFKTKRMVPHEKYLAPLGVGVTYDIALIELEEELTYSKDVRPICLSAKNQEALADRIATTAGWGDIYGNGTLPERLREGTERIVDDAVCQKTYTEYEIGPMMCTAIYNHTVTDHGDSGGPVMIMTDGRWTEVGITSYGKPPELGCPPGVYARVSHFCDWIAEKTNNEVRCDA